MQLRDYQQGAVDATINYFVEGKRGNPVVAMPTGTGKSITIAGTVQRVMQWPNQRVMVLTHVKELIEQNAEKMQMLWPEAPMGIYSAGLGIKDTVMPIIYGGVMSVKNNVKAFGRRDLLFIDEAHLLSPKEGTTYQNVIAELMEVNPFLKTVGYTATDYRLGQGRITDDGLFTDVCYDLTGVESFNRLIAQGHIVPLYPKRTKVERQSDIINLNSKGDLDKASLAADAADKETTYKALVEACEWGADRNSWLVFASTIDDAEWIAATLSTFGIPTAAVHSKMPKSERDKRIKAFKRGTLRCLANMGVLTTGFDHPALDMIVMLRRTMSPGLWVQMLGRGTRPCPETGKTDCLVLDFAGNTRRLGPINDPVIPRKKGKGGGDAPVRICDNCGTYNHAAARFCCFCNEEFTFAPKIVASAGTDELIREDVPIVEIYNVTTVNYYLHEKKNRMGEATAPPQIKVEYFCEGGLHRFQEFVQFEHPGYPSKKARDWWRQRFPGDYVPEKTAEALSEIGQLRAPHRIRVWVNKKYPEVIGYEYGN